MKKDYTPLLHRLSIIVLIVCCSTFAMASPCNSSAQWSYTNPVQDSVVFISADTNSLVQHIWVFGDGTIDTVTGTVVSHVYAAGGSYQVCQYVQYISGSCPDTLCQTITVNDTCHITAAWVSVRLGGDSMRFTAADTNSAATHIWRFSDGGFAYGVTQTTHHFATPGIYTACFYVYRGACYDSLCQSVTVSSDTCGLLASWSSNTVGGDTIRFSASNTDTSIIHLWTFGDGTQALGVTDTTHVYASSGFYTACLYLHKPGTDCYDSVCTSIAVGTNPCGITPYWNYGALAQDSVEFFSVDTNSAAHYQWNFGDGSFVTGQITASHHYASSGIYHACFYVYIPNTACSDSFCQDVTASIDTCGLSAVWHSYNLGGDSIQFMANDTSSYATYVWNFGDGSIASGSYDTIHHYAQAGTYTVCLKISGPGGICADSICQSLVVGTPPCPVTATWASYPLGGDSVAFVAADTVSSATHIWNFGDGTYSYGVTTVTHTFPSAGPYHVCFYAYELGTSCSDSLCQNITISVDTCHITSSWTADALGGDSVTFSAADTNSTAHHVWNFGDGSYTDTLHTNHAYAAPGIYHVCLYVYKPGTACSDSLCQDVTVIATAPCHITAAWTYSTVGNDSVKYIASDTNRAAHHIWSFGDGTVASGTTDTIHHYASAGTYQVCFYTYIPGTQCSDSSCQTVTVTGSTPCHISAAWTSAIVGNDSVRFTASDTNRAAHHIWSFGDGTYASGTTDTVHHYAAAGHYTVCFYSYIPATGCSDTVCQSVTVTGSSPCHVSQSWSYSAIGTDSIRFVAADTNSTAQYRWTFGDGSSASVRDTIHHYASPGSYSVCFYVSIPGTSCADSLCQTVTVTGPTPCTITAAWTYQVSHGDSFSFTASDTNSAAHHIWNLGDGTLISSSTQVNHVYGSSGSYAVCFYVYIPGTNCSDSSCQTVNVLLGINELSQSLPNITIMPNPFSQYTVIKVDGAVQAYEMNVYDVVGKVIRHESSSTNTFNIERGNLASGIYIYEVTLQGTTIGKGKMIAE